MLSNEDIKQIFFYCDNKDPEGSYADNVDIYEFGKKVSAVAAVMAAREERKKCIEFVASLNAEVAKALEEKRGRL
jgi:hypothetical protein